MEVPVFPAELMEVDLRLGSIPHEETTAITTPRTLERGETIQPERTVDDNVWRLANKLQKKIPMVRAASSCFP
jgi:hypothetical protein